MKKIIAVVSAISFAGAGMAAVVAEITAKGVVDTRLVRSGDDVASAVSDTRRPIEALSNVGRTETTPPVAMIIIR